MSGPLTVGEMARHLERAQSVVMRDARDRRRVERPPTRARRALKRSTIPPPMPWKIVNLDYAGDRPHLHIKDPNAPIHLRTFFGGGSVGGFVEVGLGGEEPDDCVVRARVSPDAVVVEATRFERVHVRILESILASLDVEPAERDDALAWMYDAIGRATPADTILPGNVASFPAPTGWPYDLTDAALLDSLRDREDVPATRLRALEREAIRRGLRPREPPRGGGAGPEVSHRRPR